MAKRDPNLTARNKRIKVMKERLRKLLPAVLNETGIESEPSLNAKIGSKADQFIDLKNEVIHSPEHYASLYLERFESARAKGFRGTSLDDLYDKISRSKPAQEYLMLFLERSYLKHYDELSKKRPTVREAEIWIGQNSADYGLLVAPRFAKGDWENDKSEIRHFKPRYWTIGHVLEKGFVVPGRKSKITFPDIDSYLNFFENVIVRHSKSQYQMDIAARYCDYVRAASEPLNVPLLIPELRYEGRTARHKYRLDFCVIDPITMEKTGFELSPWSSHSELKGTKGKSQKVINAEARANFDREMKKHKDYYRNHGIFSLIYTDLDLADMDGIFEDVKECLETKSVMTRLNFHVLSGFFKKRERR
jgi:hypothetical protein